MYQSWPSPNWSSSVEFRTSSFGMFLSGFITMLSTPSSDFHYFTTGQCGHFHQVLLPPNSFLQLLLLLGSYCYSNPHLLQGPPLLPNPKWITMPGDTYLLPALLWPKNTSVCAAIESARWKNTKSTVTFLSPTTSAALSHKAVLRHHFPSFTSTIHARPAGTVTCCSSCGVGRRVDAGL